MHKLVLVILETTSREKQKPEIPACSAMVAGAPSRHSSAAFCCMIFNLVSCIPLYWCWRI
jgi:hypothetical protein